jgi:polysaccharide pyruvyl transferase WcaK-like protein
MHGAQLNVCMRFHSVLFCQELAAPFLAIDYTRGGKIRSFLQDQHAEDRLVDLETLAGGGLAPDALMARIAAAQREGGELQRASG